jgi:hypothetical protein
MPACLPACTTSARRRRARAPSGKRVAAGGLPDPIGFDLTSLPHVKLGRVARHPRRAPLLYFRPACRCRRTCTVHSERPAPGGPPADPLPTHAALAPALHTAPTCREMGKTPACAPQPPADPFLSFTQKSFEQAADPTADLACLAYGGYRLFLISPRSRGQLLEIDTPSISKYFFQCRTFLS